jgi:hypothetical protein
LGINENIFSVFFGFSWLRVPNEDNLCPHGSLISEIIPYNFIKWALEAMP